jgi:hypothetical protein
LKKNEYKIDIKPLLKLILHRFFGDSSALIDVLVNNFPDAREGS